MSKYYFVLALERRILAVAAVFALLAPWILLSVRPASAAGPSWPETTRRGAQKDKKSSQLASTTVVISQFQVAGGGTVPAADEFVELHNVSSGNVDLNGHTLVYRSAAGTSDVLITSWTTSTIIPPGGYYLITGTTGYDDSVAGDRTWGNGTTGQFAGASGGLGLRNGPVTTGTLVDSVGYGSATNAFVETTPTTVPAGNASKARNSNGCADTDNNLNDFSLVNPSTPRNSASAANVCGGGGGPTNPSGTGAATPNSVAAGSSTLLTVTVTPGGNPTSTGITVTGDLSAIGGSAAQAFFDNGTNGDATPGDNVFSFSATVAPATANGSKNLPVQIADAQTRTGSSAIILTVTPPPATGQTLPFLQNWSNINLITTNDSWSGVAGIVGYRGDDLTTATGVDPQTILADGSATPVTVLANQTNPNTLTSGGIAEFDTLANPVVAFQGSGTSDVPHLVISLDTTGKSNITVSYNLRDVDGSTDDSIQPVALQYRIGGSGAYTNLPAGFVADASSGPDESSLVTPVNVALPAAVNNQSLVQLRIITTNANGSDEWIGVDDIAVVADGVIPLSASGSSNPNTVVQGATTLLTATVNPATNPTSTGITVTGDLSAIGGSAAQAFFDDGTNGDATPGDNIFSYLATVAAATPTGAKSLPVTVADAQARTFNFNIGLTVIVPGGGSPHTPEEHLVLGNPSGATTDVNAPDNYLLPKNQFVMSYHRDRAIPNWVSWHLDSTWIGSAPRQNDFRPDPALPAGWYQVNQSSYSGSGFDRGHHTPSADRTSSVPDNSATFFMTNMMPQAPGNNQGPWEQLESFGRTLVGQGNELYIVAGGYGTGGTGDNGFASTVDAGRVAVPSYTWKVIVVLPVGESDLSRVNANTRTIAVIMPNNTAIRPDAWQKYLATVDQVEALTGYDFFSNVPVAIQSQIESRLDAASNTAPQTVSGGVYTNLDVSGRPQTTLTGNVTVTGSLNLGPSVINTGNFKLTLAPGATVSRASGYVTGELEKQFDTPVNGFVYPVGTANGYSPVTVDVTAVLPPPALGGVISSLSVEAVQGVQPNAPSQIAALQRYWTLTENGNLTANLTFQYLQSDVHPAVLESSLKINRYENGFTELPTTLDTAANTASTTGITQFSDWTLIGQLVPTAAQVSVGGRALTASGRAIGNALVSMTDSLGQVRNVRTNQFGYYRFTNVPAGAVYVLGATHKQYSFVSRVLNVSEDVGEADLIAVEP